MAYYEYAFLKLEANEITFHTAMRFRFLTEQDHNHPDEMDDNVRAAARSCSFHATRRIALSPHERTLSRLEQSDRRVEAGAR